MNRIGAFAEYVSVDSAALAHVPFYLTNTEAAAVPLTALTIIQSLELMGANKLLGPDGFPVTRLFNRAQGIEYTNAIVDDFREHGVFFDDLLKDEQP